MNARGAGEGPGWDELVGEWGALQGTGRRTAPRHIREADEPPHLPPLPDALSWTDALAWSTLIGLGVLIGVAHPGTSLPWGP